MIECGSYSTMQCTTVEYVSTVRYSNNIDTCSTVRDAQYGAFLSVTFLHKKALNTQYGIMREDIVRPISTF
jgi:hypothetical protein